MESMETAIQQNSVYRSWNTINEHVKYVKMIDDRCIFMVAQLPDKSLHAFFVVRENEDDAYINSILCFDKREVYGATSFEVEPSTPTEKNPDGILKEYAFVYEIDPKEEPEKEYKHMVLLVHYDDMGIIHEHITINTSLEDGNTIMPNLCWGMLNPKKLEEDTKKEKEQMMREMEEAVVGNA